MQMGHASVKIDGSPDTAEPGRLNKPKRNLKARLVHEAKSFAAMFVYLWVLFGLFGLHEFSVLAQYGIHFTVYGYAAVNALVLGKVMLIAEGLNWRGDLTAGHSSYPFYTSPSYSPSFSSLSTSWKSSSSDW